MNWAVLMYCSENAKHVQATRNARGDEGRMKKQEEQ